MSAGCAEFTKVCFLQQQSTVYIDHFKQLFNTGKTVAGFYFGLKFAA